MTGSRVEIPAELVAFFRELHEAQSKAANEIKVTVGDPGTPAANQDQPGLPLIDLLEPEIDPGQYRDQFLKAGEILVRHRPEKEAEVRAAAEVLARTDLPELIRILCRRDDSGIVQLLPQKTAVSVFPFLAETALKPFLIAFAHQVKGRVDREHWGQSTCPVCGREVNFSRLQADDGRRLMYCQYCGTEWYARYLCCSRCGNDDHKLLSYLTPEDNPALQIFVCRKCKGYLKTYDERKGKDCPELPLADILTLHLDFLAEREGYSNQAGFGAGIH